MKHRLITILSLILFTAAEAGPAARPFMLNAHHPTPVYSPDGAVLITSPSVRGAQGLENLISLSLEIYSIQIGAFRVKTSAER